MSWELFVTFSELFFFFPLSSSSIIIIIIIIKNIDIDIEELWESWKSRAALQDGGQAPIGSTAPLRPYTARQARTQYHPTARLPDGSYRRTEGPPVHNHLSRPGLLPSIWRVLANLGLILALHLGLVSDWASGLGWKFSA